MVDDGGSMIKFLVTINSFYDGLARRDSMLRMVIAMFFIVVPISIIVNVGRFPWWVTSAALLFMISGFFIRFMWVVIGADMIKYMKEKESVTHDH